MREGNTMLNKTPLWKKVILYAVLIVICVATLMPLAWMLSASLKLDKDVFRIPIEWIPSQPKLSSQVLMVPWVHRSLRTTQPPLQPHLPPPQSPPCCLSPEKHGLGPPS